ncbi:hypothetical protein MA16_Dca019516 [Dendrobium catenatum]|uniref:Uncharacterized protein n=1 Tax=Dendrobium catenatum TaxID=906689 RepID=A0A2I0XJG5_9ASPA|nr:hypothetical protein MA16_Dca019516 [Dendrobium catenatum]
MAPSPCGSILRLSNACTQEDGNFLASENADKIKKKVSRIIGWGLRRFISLFCISVQVADEIIADLATLNKSSEFEAFDIRKLIVRNQHMHCSGNASSEGVALPFLLVQGPEINQNASCLFFLLGTVARYCSVSGDMARSAFSTDFFNCSFVLFFLFTRSPFSLHDEAAILKMMRCPQSAAKNQFSCSPARALNSIRDENGKPMKPASFSWNSESLTL